MEHRPSGGTRPPRAIIVGGSMAGLFAGLFLRKQGWDIAIYERIGAELAGRGAGIVTHRELFDILKEAGIEVDSSSLGVSVPGRRVFGSDGRVVGQLALPQVLTSWGKLYGLLKAALPSDCYRHGKNFVEAQEDDTSVVAKFSDGEAATGDLLIGADGLFSNVRGSSHLRTGRHMRGISLGAD
ncbi:FAD-dependent monooxygenase [Tardiphaga alba]|uniref:FAD-dependent monooxygenase n=1 Tax=Tardiphaga alba TaxID=340268 RepID=UPI002E1F2394